MHWSGGFIELLEEDIAYLSVVFSWQMQQAYQRAAWYKAQGYRVIAGGPAVYYRPDYLESVAEIGRDMSMIHLHNPQATFTSRGCIRNCRFCIVPKSEGKLIELDYWPIRPIICDNNLLACSKKHFDSVINKLKSLKNVDFNQGLDSRLLTDYHASRLAELNTRFLRLAWDHTNLENEFIQAFDRLRRAGIPARHIRVYCLIGFNDAPQDAFYRLQTVKDLGAWPNPMRYQPLDSERRNQYIGSHWTERELKHFARYWSRLRWLEHIPFTEYEFAGFRWSYDDN